MNLQKAKIQNRLLTISKSACLFFAFCFLILTNVAGQVPPNAFNYSGVARDTQGNAIASTAIGIQISILKSSSTGVPQYIENHTVTTDAFGLFNLVIGAGSIQSGDMASIDWSNDNYYLQVGMDAAGGTNFLIMGTTQLLSVPYALYAKSAGSVTSGSANVSSNIEYPDGLNGTPFFLSPGSNYTVPSGKNLYGSSLSTTTVGQYYIINGAMAPENTTISLDATYPEIALLLVDKTVEVILWQSWNVYTVPSGSKFYVKPNLGCAGGCVLYVNGNPWSNTYEWQIFPSGTTLQYVIDTNEQYLIAGYLRPN
jgi:hypothetical protein